MLCFGCLLEITFWATKMRSCKKNDTKASKNWYWLPQKLNEKSLICSKLWIMSNHCWANSKYLQFAQWITVNKVSRCPLMSFNTPIFSLLFFSFFFYRLALNRLLNLVNFLHQPLVPHLPPTNLKLCRRREWMNHITMWVVLLSGYRLCKPRTARLAFLHLKELKQRFHRFFWELCAKTPESFTLIC